jgi:hypothetical protein
MAEQLSMPLDGNEAERAPGEKLAVLPARVGRLNRRHNEPRHGQHGSPRELEDLL